MNITYRFLTSLEDYKECVRLQKEVWEFEDIDIVPIPLLVIAKENGGFLYGAFDGDKLIGFVYSILGIKNNELIHCSHMLAVLPEYRDKGIGYCLKLKQREFALNQSINLITWTFDPFQVKNAFFNIEKLGIIVKEYKENIYGETSSPLHYGLPTDRMLAEWYINSRRVKEFLTNENKELEIDNNVLIFNLLEEKELREEGGTDVLIEVPSDFKKIADIDRNLALEIIKRARVIFKYFFEKDYIITRFFIKKETNSNKYFYFLKLKNKLYS